MNKNVKLTVSFFLLFIFIYFFIDYVTENIQIITTFKNINLGMVVIFVLINLAVYINRTFINIYLFRCMHINLPFNEAFNLVYLNTLGNLLGPLKAGSGYKLIYLNKYHKLKIADYISLNTSYAIITLILNLILVVALLPFNEEGLSIDFNLSGFLIFVIILSLTLLFRITNFFGNTEKIQIIKNFVEGFNSLIKNKKNLVYILIVSTIQIIFSVTTIYLCFLLFNFQVSLLSCIIYIGVAAFTGVIKITPGNIGFYEIFMIFTNGLHGVDTFYIITTSVFLRLISYATIGVLGVKTLFNKSKNT
tara:strand:+ start:1205 stop:2119 length:915 start_codon:yes stop_codon:yes gene_type:complete